MTDFEFRTIVNAARNIMNIEMESYLYNKGSIPRNTTVIPMVIKELGKSGHFVHNIPANRTDEFNKCLLGLYTLSKRKIEYIKKKENSVQDEVGHSKSLYDYVGIRKTELDGIYAVMPYIVDLVIVDSAVRGNSNPTAMDILKDTKEYLKQHGILWGFIYNRIEIQDIIFERYEEIKRKRLLISWS